MGGGGGDGGAGARQAAQDAAKARTRNSLNALFGVKPSAPDQANYPSDFVFRGEGVERPNGSTTPATPGQVTPAADSAYTAAMQQYQSQIADAEKNKAARDALYAKVRGDAFTAGRRGIDEGKTTAARENKFALLAQGLAGGSEDIDQNALLSRTYSQGLLNLGGKADAAKADMMGNDEATRLQLLQSVDAGMDEGSAISSALGQLKVNSDRAAAEAIGTDLGDLFGGAGLLYTKSSAARGANQARFDYSSLFQNNRRGTGAASKSNSGGIISSAGLDGPRG